MKKQHIQSMISKLLEMAGDRFSNHGYNDLDDNFFDGMDKDDIQELYEEYHKWNGDPEEYDPKNIGYLGDSCLMSFFSDKIKTI